MSEFNNGCLNLVNKLNSFNNPGSIKDTCYKFIVDNTEVGFVNPKIVEVLKAYNHILRIEDKSVILLSKYKTKEERTQAIEELLIDLREKSIFKKLDGWRNEHYNVRYRFSCEPIFEIERSAVSLLGIKAYGCHINGYVLKNNEYFLWIARRSKTKQTFPNMLDNFVGGGLTAGLTLIECAVKELNEEAGLDGDVVKSLKSVDAITYAYEEENNEGVCIEGEFVFDIKLPEDFVPKNTDGEVGEFYLMNIEQVKKAIISPEFKPNSAAITLGFLIRKGLVNPDDLPNYLEILEKMHSPAL